MGLTWTWWALPAIVGALTAWSAAVVLLRTASGRSLNRRLATVLFLEGVWLSAGIFFLVEDRGAFMAIAAIGVGAMAALPFQYLSFLSVALETPLVAPFRSRTALVALSVLSMLAFASLLIRTDLFIGELYSPPWATWNFHLTFAGTLLALALALTSLFGLICSITAYLAADRGSAARQRARWFAIAFGVRDIFNASWWGLYGFYRDIPFWGDFISNIGPALVMLAYMLLMAYGVLRFQLFDIDLKLKFALTQGTVGMIIAAGFFLGSEVLEGVVQGVLPIGGTLLGLVVAAAVVLALRPVQRFAEALADRLMPGVRATPDYVDSRKHEVYRAALEGAFEDQEITERERSMLRRLREKLEISPEVAAELEAGLRDSSLAVG